MKRLLMLLWFLASVLVFGLPAMYHVFEAARVLDIMRIPAGYEQLGAFHRAIDTVPGASVPGGWHHREIWGHDIGSLEKLLSSDSSGLSVSQKKIAWAVHVLQDYTTKAGVPYESVMEARKILSREFFKLATIRGLMYAGILGIFDFIYQWAFLDVDARVALRNALKTFGITSGITIGVNFLVSRIFPIILQYNQSSGFLSFMSSGMIAPVIYIVIDVILRSIETGSLAEALFSPQTLLNAVITALFLVPGGQPIASAIMVFTLVFNWFKASEVRARYELFDEVFNEKYDEYLLAQAEMSVR